MSFVPSWHPSSPTCAHPIRTSLGAIVLYALLSVLGVSCGGDDLNTSEESSTRTQELGPESCGDGQCTPDEDCANCPLDCGACAQPCCETSPSPGCVDEAIEACVCAEDSYCCTNQWDAICVREVGQLHCATACECGDGVCPWYEDSTSCPADCGIVPTSCCEEATTPGCEPPPGAPGIEDCVCAQDPFCCTTAWDETCVRLVDELRCGTCTCNDDICESWEDCESCPSDCGECALDCCATHPSAGCVEDRVEECVCDEDPYCCTTQWDGICVQEVTSLSCGVCSCGDGTCQTTTESCASCPTDCGSCQQDGCTATPGVPGITHPEIESCVCATDSYCCTTAWDNICVGEVESFGCGTCSCGDGTCDEDFETSENCLADCGPPQGDCCVATLAAGCTDSYIEGNVCGTLPGAAFTDPWCCDIAWDGLCVSHVTEIFGAGYCDCGDGLCDLHENTLSCNADCTPDCGDGTCGEGESYYTCVADCGSVSTLLPNAPEGTALHDLMAAAWDPSASVISAEITLIGEEDFQAVLGASTPQAPVTAAIELDAMRLAGLTSDPVVMGVRATYYEPDPQTGQDAYTDDAHLFLVVRDPVWSEDGTTSKVEGHDFYVAAIDVPVSGISWFGKGIELGLSADIQLPRSCCGNPQELDLLCAGIPPTGGGGCGGPHASCLGMAKNPGHCASIEDLIENMSGVPGDHTQLRVAEDPAYCPQFETSEHKLTGTFWCEICTKSLDTCDFTVNSYGQGIEDTRADGACGQSGVNVPEICTQIHAPDTIPAQCGGFSPATFDPFGGSCHQADLHYFPWVSGATLPHPSEGCAELPPICQYVQDDPEAPGRCTVGVGFNFFDKWAAYQCDVGSISGVAPNGYACCGERCACKEVTGPGDQEHTLCMQCNDRWECRQYYEQDSLFDERAGAPVATLCGPNGDEACGDSTSSKAERRAGVVKKTTQEEEEEDKEESEGSTSDTVVAPEEKPAASPQQLGSASGQPAKPAASPAAGSASPTKKADAKAAQTLENGSEDGPPIERVRDRRVPSSRPDQVGVEKVSSPPVQQDSVEVEGGTGARPSTAGDPVLLSDGSLLLEHTDIALSGPARALEFRRIYTSTSNERSILGSNWTHNFDARVEVIKPSTAPDWVASYCSDWFPEPTCLFYHDGMGTVRLFLRDPHTRLFVPHAGSTDTIRMLNGNRGWALRSAHGDLRLFNSQGYLVEERDRLGNGYTVELEPTPLFSLYQRYCDLKGLIQRTEEYQPKYCRILGRIFGDVEEAWDPAGWAVTEADLAEFPADARPDPSDPTPAAIQLAELRRQRAFFLHLLQQGVAPEATTGNRRLHPRSVRDDIDRVLEFHYHWPTTPLITPEAFETFPEAGLLAEVRGPAGISVKFTYDRPEGYPARLNETFLTGVHRVDGQPSEEEGLGLRASKVRSYRFTWQWPSEHVLSYNASGWRQDVFDTYLAFYDVFTGCAVTTEAQCCFDGENDGRPAYYAGPSGGEPCFMALLAEQAYVSDVADNITRVEFGGKDALFIESETFYDPDPDHADTFDRAVAQRYGDPNAIVSNPAPPIWDDLGVWTSTQPLFTFDYLTAFSPSLLPDALTAGLYEVETGEPPVPDDPPVFVLPAQAGTETECVIATINPDPTPRTCDLETLGGSPALPQRACRFDLIEWRRSDLPGYVSSTGYYPLTGLPEHPVRSLLTCEQLAAAHFGDPLANENVHRIEVDGDNAVAELVVGGRAAMEQDLRRICRWAHTVNRDGVSTWWGMNFRGQTLVHAHELGEEGFLIAETLYNADGNIIQQRPPFVSSVGRPNPIQGATYYTWDTAAPDEDDGWAAWRPAFWARRGNLLRVESTPDGDAMYTDIDETPTQIASLGVEISYEPLFNQPQVTTWSMREASTLNRRRLATRVVWFDYQELAAPSSSATSPMAVWMEQMSLFGMDWAELPTQPGGQPWTEESTWFERVDWANAENYQLAQSFFDTDLNGDGVQGFSNDTRADLPRHRIKGLPIVIWSGGLDEDPFPSPGATVELDDPLRVTRIAWAPQGQPLAVEGPQGRVEMAYYRAREGSPLDPEDIYGDVGSPPEANTSGAVAPNHAGFLAWVSRRRFNPRPEADGPTTAPCALLAAPYRWLLPASCTDAEDELLALGLAPEVVAAVLATDEDEVEVTQFAYNRLGHVLRTWIDHEVATPRHVTTFRDTDGRPLTQIDPMGNFQTWEWSPLGEVVQSESYDNQSRLMARSVWQYDLEGRPLTACQALSGTGCWDVESPVAAFGTPSTAVSQLQTWRYNGEGHLIQQSDPLGVVTTRTLNTLGWPLVVQTHRASLNDGIADRRVAFEWSAHGQLVRVDYGTEAARQQSPGIHSEIYAYDGLRRLVIYHDTRGTRWDAAWRLGDQLARLTITGHDATTWEIERDYDSLGRPTHEIVQGGAAQTSWTFWPDGQLASITSTGAGTTFMTSDAQGRPLWARTPDGSDTLSTFELTGLTQHGALIRRSPSSHLSTSVQTLTDALGRPITQTTTGHNGEVQTSTATFDALGRMLERIAPDGRRTRTAYNLLGWPLQQEEQISSTQYAKSLYTYNGRGQTLTVTDPVNQVSTFEWNAFGELAKRSLPGLDLHAWAYDGFGRLMQEFPPNGHALAYLYDERGDQVSDHWTNAPDSTLQIERTFDGLGRLTSATHHNLSTQTLNLLSAADVPVRRELTWDTLGRLASETLVLFDGSMELPTTSTWTLTSSNTWKRTLDYPSAWTWQEDYNTQGQLQKLKNSQEGRFIDFDYLGELPTSRTHDLGPTAAEEVQSAFGYDGLGRQLSWRYAAKYAWTNPANSGLLLQIDVLRDVIGQIGSEQWRYGHPRPDGAGGILPDSTQPRPWRGYRYDVADRLSRFYTHSGASPAVDTSSLINHTLTDAQLLSFAQSTYGLLPWSYTRNSKMGQATKIAKSGQPNRLEAAYASTHELTSLKRDGGSTVTLSTDSAGQITDDGRFLYSYDPSGLLVSAEAGGVLREAYLWTDDGRMAARLDDDGLVEAFAYDGPQLIAAYSPAQVPLWEAVWGQGLDELLEVRQGTTPHAVLTDSRHSVRALWDGSQISDLVEYDPEGRLTLTDDLHAVQCTETDLSSPCPTPTPFSLNSAWRSPVTGLVWMRARWYSPHLAQFTSTDPLLFIDSFNLWVFAHFDSINRWDPWGMGSDRTKFGYGVDGEKFVMAVYWDAFGSKNAKAGHMSIVVNNVHFSRGSDEGEPRVIRRSEADTRGYITRYGASYHLKTLDILSLFTEEDDGGDRVYHVNPGYESQKAVYRELMDKSENRIKIGIVLDVDESDVDKVFNSLINSGFSKRKVYFNNCTTPITACLRQINDSVQSDGDKNLWSSPAEVAEDILEKFSVRKVIVYGSSESSPDQIDVPLDLPPGIEITVYDQMSE